ncbi:hypothetical protein [Hasllibacter sp. MH4015]|uniref:hypothetical protein n=1 Tax=Hasllibacter sp. MH4015 TaxID=2854029 RepID=UPI001CD1B339|nr:hypothetical protein [Hasllibacter sp. MH4015]
MTRFLPLILASFLVPATGNAEVEFLYAEVFETRYGDIRVGGEQFQQTLWHDRTQLPLPEDARWWVQWAEQGEGAYDWVLASHHHGGNSCGGGFYILRLDESGVAQSREISDCDGLLLDIRTGAGWIEIDRTDLDIEVPLVTVRWNGTDYSETHHFDPIAPPAGAGADVTRWVGDSGYSILQDAGERARFGAEMEIWDMQDLATRLSVGTGVEQAGDWIFATGCQPHACGLEMGAIGVRVSDGAVAAIIRSSDQTDRVFGLGDDPAFRALVAEGLE